MHLYSLLAIVITVIFTGLGTAKLLAVEPMRQLATEAGFSTDGYRRIGALEVAGAIGIAAGFAVPLLGRLLPGGAAYTYLPASVRRFPGPEELAELLGSCGFEAVRFRLFAGGIVALHVGEADS